MKRLVIVLLIIAALAAAVFVLYYYLWYKPAPAVPSSTTGGAAGNAPEGAGAAAPTGGTAGGATASQFGVLSQNPAADYFVDAQNNAFLIQPDGQITEITNGTASLLSSSQISNLISAAFSYDGKKIFVSFGSASNPQSSVFDIATKSWQPLPSGLKSIVWSPSDYRLAYLTTKGTITTLATLDASSTKTQPTTLLSLHAEDLKLYWPSLKQIILSDKGSALFVGSAWSFDLKKKTLVPLISSEWGLKSAWNGFLNEGLVFETGISQRGGNLSLMDTAGNKLNDLTFLTLPSKCSFNTEGAGLPQSTTTNATATQPKTAAVRNFLYCAVPRDKQKISGTTLPDDYEKKALFTADDIYKINLSDGSINVVFANQNADVDATNLKVFNKALFFINRLDQKLYVITAVQD